MSFNFLDTNTILVNGVQRTLTPVDFTSISNYNVDKNNGVIMCVNVPIETMVTVTLPPVETSIGWTVIITTIPTGTGSQIAVVTCMDESDIIGISTLGQNGPIIIPPPPPLPVGATYICGPTNWIGF